jgi:hypothetical protein
MNVRNATLWISSIVVAMFAGAAVTQAQMASKADIVAAVTKMENDSVKADLAGDKAFYAKTLAQDWTGGDSDGVWFTKADALKMMDDKKNNMTSSEKITGLKVRVYGNAAVATYKDTYDGMMDGKHRARTVISTDTFAKIGPDWKLVASHSAIAK